VIFVFSVSHDDVRQWG